MGVPFDFGDDVLMSVHAVNLAVFWEAHVDDADSLICRAGGYQDIVLGMKGQGIDGVRVGRHTHDWSRIRAVAQIDQTECVVV